MTPDELEEQRAIGRLILEGMIPFASWLAMRPRTAEDVAFYHGLVAMADSLARHGDQHAGIDAQLLTLTTKLPNSEFFVYSDPEPVL